MIHFYVGFNREKYDFCGKNTMKNYKIFDHTRNVLKAILTNLKTGETQN